MSFLSNGSLFALTHAITESHWPLCNFWVQKAVTWDLMPLCPLPTTILPMTIFELER